MEVKLDNLNRQEVKRDKTKGVSDDGNGEGKTAQTKCERIAQLEMPS